MAEETPFLRIDFHLVGGAVTSYVVDDRQEGLAFLQKLNPGRLFVPKEIVIGGRFSLSIIATETICYVDFVGGEGFAWSFPPNIHDAVDVTREQFQQRETGRPGREERVEQHVLEGTQIVGYAEIHLLEGSTLYHRLITTATLQNPVDRALTLHHMLHSSPALVARREGGGAVVVNTANITQISLYPGPEETPPNAWKARRVAESTRMRT